MAAKESFSKLVKVSPLLFVCAVLAFGISIALTAVADESVPGTVKWNYATGDLVFSSPAVGLDGTVYIGSDDGYLYAVNSDGTRKWRYSTGTREVRSSPAIGPEGTIYVGTWNENVVAVKPDGTLKWEYPVGYAFCSPAVGSDGTVYIGSQSAFLYAFSSDGTLKWQCPTTGMLISSPAIGPDGTIYVGSTDDNLYAINPDGTIKWQYSPVGDVRSSPAIGSDGTVYIGSNNGYLYAIDPSGNLKWSFYTASSGDQPSSPAIGPDGAVYIGSADNNLYAIGQDGEQKWIYTTDSPITSSPAIGADGTVYVGSGGGFLYAVDSSGQLVWKCQVGDSIWASSPAIGADGTVYIGSEDGSLYAVYGNSGGLADSSWPMFHHDLLHTGRLGEGYSVSGTVTLGSDPFPGVTVTLTDSTGTSRTATTGTDGIYIFPGVANGDYTLTAGKTGFEFSPSSISVSVFNADVAGQDFSAVLYSISGTITSGGSGLSGVTVRLTGAASASTATDSNGAYSFTNLANGAYTITPAKTGYSFNPASIGTNVQGRNVTRQNFAAVSLSYVISGTVLKSGSPLSGVTVTLTGDSSGTARTGSDGTYAFTKPNGNYTLTPSKNGYLFSPAKIAVTVAGSAVTGKDFSAVLKVATVRINLPAASASNPGAAYRMIGIPVIPDNPDTFTTLARFFGGTADSRVWRLFNSRSVQIVRRGQDAVKYGKGWWLVSAVKKTISIKGTPKTNDFRQSKTAGYQMIACPYVDGNVSWTSVRTDPANSSLGLANVIYGWKGSGEYTSTTVMVPGQSYWVESTGSGTLQIKRSHMIGATASSTRAGMATASAVAQNEASGTNSSPGAPPLPPSAVITMMYPSGGENLSVGRTYQIRWSSNGISPPGFTSKVSIFYSKNGGKTWAAIAKGVKNSGSYGWKVPKMSSTDCLVKVVSVLYPKVSGQSAAIFQIKTQSQSVSGQ